MKKRFIGAAAGAAFVLAAAIPAGSGFAARKPHTLSPEGKAVRCATLASQITSLQGRAATTTDPNTKAVLTGLAQRLQAKFNASCV